MMRCLLPIIICVVLGACNRPKPPVAKPEAYARVVDYGREYVAVDSLPLHFEVNANARLTRKDMWLNVTYPAYRATVYLTFTPAEPDAIASIIDNRMERAHLNLASAAGLEISEIVTDEFTSRLLQSESTTATPLQFVSTDGERWVVSGAVFFENVMPNAPLDSLRPMVETIRRDLIHGLSKISYK